MLKKINWLSFYQFLCFPQVRIRTSPSIVKTKSDLRQPVLTLWWTSAKRVNSWEPLLSAKCSRGDVWACCCSDFVGTNWLMSCFRSLLSHVKHMECSFASCQAVSTLSGKLDQDSDLYQPPFFHFALFILARLCAVAVSYWREPQWTCLKSTV